MNETYRSHPSLEQLSAFALGKLDEAASATLEDHVARCPQCLQVVEAQATDSFVARLQSAAAEPAETDTLSHAAVESCHELPTQAPAAPAPSGEAAGRQVVPPPGFEFVRELGRGGFGSVWLARHVALDKRVAIKHLHPDRVSSADLLVREARTMAALKVHPNRVTVFDLVQTAAGWFLVMDYVEGGPLSDLCDPLKPMDWVRAARYVANVADGLAEVHARGVFHLDIKPDNILLDSDRDQAVLTDFGIACAAAETCGARGTFGYMAPELFDGQASAKADVYALAATLYRLATGRAPFQARTAVSALGEAMEGISESALAALPAPLAPVVRAGLDPDPERRPTLAEFTARLSGCYTRALADRLRALAEPTPRPVRLGVTVSTASEKDLVFRTVFRGALPGDGPAAWPAVRCDAVVRIEAEAEADGYLTVLDLSTSGEVSVLFPNPRTPDNRVRAGRPQRLTVKMTPPAGKDHAVLVWTARPCHLSAREWRERIETGRLVVPARTERGMEFVAIEDALPAGPDWVAAVVGIEHGD